MLKQKKSDNALTGNGLAGKKKFRMGKPARIFFASFLAVSNITAAPRQPISIADKPGYSKTEIPAAKEWDVPRVGGALALFTGAMAMLFLAGKIDDRNAKKAR